MSPPWCYRFRWSMFLYLMLTSLPLDSTSRESNNNNFLCQSYKAKNTVKLARLFKALFPNLFSTVPLSPRSNLSITLLQEGKTRCDQFSVNHLNILLQWCLKVFFKIPTLFISDLTDLKTFFWPIWIIGSLKKLKLGNFLI